MKHVLVLGAGLVARPLIQYLLDQPDFHVTVASRTAAKAAALLGCHARGSAVAFDIVADIAELDNLVARADLTISLLPYVHHVRVAEACLRHRKHLITTSYVSDAMRALDDGARERGVLLLNEIGLDPGIDHMSAQRIIHRVHQAGGRIEAFRSYCGGLPAPEANDNPLGYKFSWSPRGVVLAGRNDARYLEHGHVVEIPNTRLFATHFLLWVKGLGDFEAYPNRNSLPYIELYGIPEAHTVYRGTLRNIGWCDVMQKLNELGYFSLDERADLPGKTFRQLMVELMHEVGSPPTENLMTDLAAYLNLSPSSGAMQAIEWLGLLADEPVPSKTTLLDILAEQLLFKMSYRAGERDMVVLVHDFIAAYPPFSEAGSPGRRERISSTLIDFGVPYGDSAMARTVGLPAAIAARLILEREITLSGVHIPVLPEIYEPVLAELEGLGIVCEEQARGL